MRAQYYQVTGSTPLAIDYPNGETKAHRPGSIFKIAPSNRGVQRGLRTKRLRILSDRESNSMRNAELVVPKKGPPSSVQMMQDDMPIVVLPDTPGE
jgi:hypothetical protein